VALRQGFQNFQVPKCNDPGPGFPPKATVTVASSLARVSFQAIRLQETQTTASPTVGVTLNCEKISGFESLQAAKALKFEIITDILIRALIRY
jgi:hypothetical protein